MKRQGNKLIIPESEYVLGMKKRVRGVQYSAALKAWFIYITPDTVPLLLKEFGDKVAPLLATAKEVMPIPPEVAHRKFKTQPRDYQLEALGKAFGRQFFGYFMEQGLGKTKVLIDEVAIMADDLGTLDESIVVCPKTVIDVWLEELEIHGEPEWFVRFWDSDHGYWMKRQESQFGNFEYVPDDSGYLTEETSWSILNIDALVWPIRDERPVKPKIWPDIQNLLNFNTQVMLTVDESTLIKSHKADRTQRMWDLGLKAEYRRILTGTPMAKDPLDFYSQLWFLDEQIVNGWSFSGFKSQYAILGGYKDREVFGFKNLDELSAIMEENGYRATKDDKLDLPPKIYQKRSIELNRITRRAYDLAVEEIRAEIETIGGKKTQVEFSAWALARLMKLRQLSGGAMLDGKRVVYTGDEKLKALLEVLEQSPLPALVWCEFRHEVTRIRDTLKKAGYKVGILYGATPLKKRREVIAATKASKLDILVVQNDTGRFGLTLVSASVSIHYSNSFSYQTRAQSEDRIHRIGQTADQVTYVDLVAKRTIDERIAYVLRRKENMARSVLDSKTLREIIL